MEYASMSERILRSIESIIKNDSDLQDFTIVATDDNTRNKSPVLYEEHHLGLESWCIKYVYQYVCSKLMKIRKCLAQKRITYSAKEDLNYLIIGALFINPDVTTFWNMRRELLEGEVLNYEQEFLFSKLVLTRKPKSNDAFSYRRWLINRITAKMIKNGLRPHVSLLESEIAVCNYTADSTPNNYHSWTHRQWCMLKLAHDFPEAITSELELSEKWISIHVSENTGYHYRQFLMDRFNNNCEHVPVLSQYFDKVMNQLNILNDGEFIQFLTYMLGKPAKSKSLEDLPKYINYIILILHELLVVIESINKVYIEHESLWLHRRYCIYKLLEISCEFLGENVNTPRNIDILKNAPRGANVNILDSVLNESNGEKQPKIFKSQPSKFESSNMYQIICDTEKRFVNKNLIGTATQCQLAKRHEKWLRCVVALNIS